MPGVENANRARIAMSTRPREATLMLGGLKGFTVLRCARSANNGRQGRIA